MFEPVDVVVCAHNEEASITPILAAIKGADGLGRLIVVADACTDRTVELAAELADEVVEVNWADKGSAMETGLRSVTTPQVAFVDADLSGLTTAHVTALLTTPPPHAQVVGLRDGYPMSAGRLPPISGERRVPTQVAIDAGLFGSSWEAETRINATCAAAGVPWVHIAMTGVRNPRRSKPVEWLQVGVASVRHGRELLRYVRASRRIG